MPKVSVLLLSGALATVLSGQVPSRIAGPIDESAIVRRAHTTHPLAIPANDLGPVEPGLAMNRILLLLARAPEQQMALERLLADQQDPASPRYRQWLTPEQFGRQFGPSAEDLETVTGWLAGHGFQVANIARGRNVIEFSGSARQVEAAFHTPIHRYRVDGETRIANSLDIAIPAALAPVVSGVLSLHDFPRRTAHHTGKPGVSPEYNSPGGQHYLAPYDFAAIYNLLPLWNNGFDGTGQIIAIPGRSNIKMSDISAFRTAYGLPGNNAQVVLNGQDPGDIGGSDEQESDVDVEWSGAAAKGAVVKLVVSETTHSSDGVDLSSQYIVDNNLAAILSLSYYTCEAAMGSSGNQFFSSLWSQAAAQGISVFAITGDSGSAACDTADQAQPVSHGLAVSGQASTPYNVAVGGTAFNDTSSPGAYWNSSNDSYSASALGYIPEVAWNESPPDSGPWAGGGGVSTIYPTPAWQTGAGVPAADPGASGQHHRYLPDVSLSAATHDAYLVYEDGQVANESGTSVASPAMAGIMALVNQYTGGGRNGNPNPRLYSLAASVPSVFHDVTAGTNAVPCLGGSPNCSTAAPAGNVGVLTGYSAGAGFDLATGWGSVDAYALALNWGTAGPATHFTVWAPALATPSMQINFTVAALDASNRTANQYAGTVHFTSTDPAAILPANSVLSGGSGTFTATLNTAGNQTITATDSVNPSIAGTSSAIAVGALANLVITSLTAPTTASPGAQISAGVTVANQGGTAAGAFQVEFFFSSGPVLSGASIGPGSNCPVSSLAAGASATLTCTVAVPASLPAGTWYLIADADSNTRPADTGPLSISANRPPSPISANPAYGSALAHTFTFLFSDPDGWQNLGVVNVLINNFLDGRNACYLAYSRTYGVLFLVDNDGGTLLPALPLNGSGSVSNGQCTVTGAGSSANGSGTTLTLTLNLSFTSTFAGNKVIYMAAGDTAGNNSGWQALGTFGVPGASTFPAVGGVTPPRGNGRSQTFVFTFSDTKGFQDLGVENVLINNFLDGRQACYLAYVRSSNVLYLVADDGGTLLPGMLLNNTGSVSNGQCTVTGAGSYASGSGNNLTLTLNVTFSASFIGNRVLYLAARDSTDANNSGWQSMGSWTVQ